MEAEQAKNKVNGKAEKPAVPEQPKDPAKELSDAAVQKLIAGEAQPRSEMSKYAVERAREAMSANQQIQERILFARNMLKQLEADALRVEGQVDAYVRDVKHWESRALEESKTMSPPVAEPKA